jgi:hypothetical protein
MARERVPRPERKMKPVYIVFCEGETEDNYIAFLRLHYRVPIKVISKITGQKISQALIERHVKAERIAKDDVVSSFVMYDLDVPGLSERLNRCKATHLISNPCIELWFLLHEHNQCSNIATDACVTKLKKISPDWNTYAKGSLSKSQQKILSEKVAIAIERAKGLSFPENPSSTLYDLIEKLEEILQQELRSNKRIITMGNNGTMDHTE